MLYYLDSDNAISLGEPVGSNERYYVFMSSGAAYPKIISKDEVFLDKMPALAFLIKKLTAKQIALNNDISYAYTQMADIVNLK